LNLFDFLPNQEKAVATQKIMKGNSSVTLLQLQKDATLAEHQSRVDALLVLLSGNVRYVEVDREVELTQQHDCVKIPAKVSHSLHGREDSVLLLIQ
jgi:quercetin dioxygenase-like cupin family protein